MTGWGPQMVAALKISVTGFGPITVVTDRIHASPLTKDASCVSNSFGIMFSNRAAAVGWSRAKQFVWVGGESRNAPAWKRLCGLWRSLDFRRSISVAQSTRPGRRPLFFATACQDNCWQTSCGVIRSASRGLLFTLQAFLARSLGVYSGNGWVGEVEGRTKKKRTISSCEHTSLLQRLGRGTYKEEALR